MNLNRFHALNYERMCKDFAPAHDLQALTICVQEEVGELASAVLGFTGEKKRKAHLGREDVLDAVADAITYLSLVASVMGEHDLEDLLERTFDTVSERVGSKIVLSPSAQSLDGGAPDQWRLNTSIPFPLTLRPNETVIHNYTPQMRMRFRRFVFSPSVPATESEMVSAFILVNGGRWHSCFDIPLEVSPGQEVQFEFTNRHSLTTYQGHVAFVADMWFP